MKFRLIFIVAAAALLAACGPTQEQLADYEVVYHSGANPAIYDKMMHGDPLSVGDICALHRAGVNDGIVIRYIRDQGTVYLLSSADFGRLKSAGVSSSVIDYMAHTGYPPPYPYGPYPYPYYPYPYPPIGVGIGFGFGGGHCWR